MASPPVRAIRGAGAMGKCTTLAEEWEKSGRSGEAERPSTGGGWNGLEEERGELGGGDGEGDGRGGVLEVVGCRCRYHHL